LAKKGGLAGVAQGEVERQPAEDIEATTGSGDQHALSLIELVEERGC
jgi:hypothetical protein